MGFQKLPFELVTAAFDYLPQKDLRRAASVSHMLYSAAQEAGLYINQRIHLHGDRQTSPQAFIALVDYVACKPDRPGLALTLWCTDSARLQDIMRTLFPAITAALPFLVRLSVCVPADCRGALYEALCFPAPRLRVLALGQSYRLYNDPENWIPLPQNLFAGSAHRLREVFLSAPSLDIAWQEPIAAFRHVYRADISLTSADAHLQTARFFPNVRALWLSVQVPDWILEYSEPVVDLAGLRLRHLSILDELVESVHSEIPLRELRYVEQIGALAWDETLWPEDAADGDFYAHFVGTGCAMRFSLGPLSGEWTRALCPWGLDLPDQALLKSLSLVCARLGSLTLHNDHLVVFLECKVTLSALTELIIDLTPDSLESQNHGDAMHNQSGHARDLVHCPALHTLSLLSADADVEVSSEYVVALAQALRLAARAQSRSDGDGAVLQLIGVNFANPSQREPILSIFADVSEGLAFVGRVAEQYYRGAGEGGDIYVTFPFYY